MTKTFKATWRENGELNIKPIKAKSLRDAKLKAAELKLTTKKVSVSKF